MTQCPSKIPFTCQLRELDSPQPGNSVNFWRAGGWWGFSAAQLVLFLGHHAEPSSDWQPALSVTHGDRYSCPQPWVALCVSGLARSFPSGCHAGTFPALCSHAGSGLVWPPLSWVCSCQVPSLSHVLRSAWGTSGFTVILSSSGTGVSQMGSWRHTGSGARTWWLGAVPGHTAGSRAAARLPSGPTCGPEGLLEVFATGLNKRGFSRVALWCRLIFVENLSLHFFYTIVKCPRGP